MPDADDLLAVVVPGVERNCAYSTTTRPNNRFKTAPSFMNAGRSGSGALRLAV